MARSGPDLLGHVGHHVYSIICREVRRACICHVYARAAAPGQQPCMRVCAYVDVSIPKCMYVQCMYVQCMYVQCI